MAEEFDAGPIVAAFVDHPDKLIAFLEDMEEKLNAAGFDTPTAMMYSATFDELSAALAAANIPYRVPKPFKSPGVA